MTLETNSGDRRSRNVEVIKERETKCSGILDQRKYMFSCFQSFKIFIWLHPVLVAACKLLVTACGMDPGPPALRVQS